MEDKQTQRVNLFLDPEVVLKAKVQSLKEKLSFSQLTDKALKEYIMRNNQPKVKVRDFDPLDPELNKQSDDFKTKLEIE